MRQQIEPLELFSFYYLGLSPEGTYKFSNANQMARYFNTTVPDIMSALRAAGLHPDAVVNTEFPMALYQVELQLASIDGEPGKLLGMASRIYDEFRAHAGKRRDWAAEIASEQGVAQHD